MRGDRGPYTASYDVMLAGTFSPLTDSNRQGGAEHPAMKGKRPQMTEMKETGSNGSPSNRTGRIRVRTAEGSRYVFDRADATWERSNPKEAEQIEGLTDVHRGALTTYVEPTVGEPLQIQFKELDKPATLSSVVAIELVQPST